MEVQMVEEAKSLSEYNFQRVKVPHAIRSGVQSDGRSWLAFSVLENTVLIALLSCSCRPHDPPQPPSPELGSLI